MDNLTLHEVKLLQDLIHQKLDSVTNHTPALLVTQYTIILTKLEQVQRDLMVERINSIINETLNTNDTN